MASRMPFSFTCCSLYSLSFSILIFICSCSCSFFATLRWILHISCSTMSHQSSNRIDALVLSCAIVLFLSPCVQCSDSSRWCRRRWRHRSPSRAQEHCNCNNSSSRFRMHHKEERKFWVWNEDWCLCCWCCLYKKNGCSHFNVERTPERALEELFTMYHPQHPSCRFKVWTECLNYVFHGSLTRSMYSSMQEFKMLCIQSLPIALTSCGTKLTKEILILTGSEWIVS